MKRLFAVILFALVSLGAVAQQVAPSSTSTTGAAASTRLVGLYDGNFVGAHGRNLFWLTAQQIGNTPSGDVNFYSSLRECRGTVPFTGTVQDSGTIVLNIKGRVPGCERVMVLQQTADDGRWIGTVTPQDGMRPVPWDVVLTRTQ